MAQVTKIQWTGATVNFWTGCHKKSPGCKFCYMYRDKERYGKEPNEVVRVSNRTVENTLRKLTKPSRIFTCSWSDFFIEEADNWRCDAWKVIKQHPQHQWQILTKRPERIEECLPTDWGDGWENVWLGVSVENQHYFERVDILSQIPSKTKFVSAEPLLAEINVLQKFNGKRPIDNINWIILGGESGNETGRYLYRPSEISWFERIVRDVQKEAPHCAIFNKQLGTHLHRKLGLKDRMGGEIEEWPDSLNHLKVRDFPRALEKANLFF